MNGYLVKAFGTDPFSNLAMEEYLFNCVENAEKIILYLWQNEDTVVIGRNQNAYTECNADYVIAKGIHVVRRITGGGAVFHDLGNLNYSLILPKYLYKPCCAEKMLLAALNGLGITAAASGRNDICLGKEKISGNAYYLGCNAALCHGTLLYKVDKEKVEKSLNVSNGKLVGKGITSVKSRVSDIASHYPAITMIDLIKAIKKEVAAEYDLRRFHRLSISEKDFAELREKYASHEWNWEKVKDYSLSLEKSFDWGVVRVSLFYAGDSSKDVEISSDALDADFIDEIRNYLRRMPSVSDYSAIALFFKEYADKHLNRQKQIDDLDSIFAELFNREDRLS